MTDQPCNRPTEIPVHWEVVLPTRIIWPFLVLRQLLCSLQKVDIPRSMTKSDQTHLIDNVIFLVMTRYLPGLGIDKRKKESEQESKHARVHANTHASTQKRTRSRKHALVDACVFSYFLYFFYKFPALTKSTPFSLSFHHIYSSISLK